jgi:hypothetical protein
MPGPLDRRRQLALMAEAIARNPARDDASALRQKIPQETDILEINGAFLDAKPAGPAPLKESSAASAITPPASTPATFAFHNIPRQLLRFFVFVGRILLRGDIPPAAGMRAAAVSAFRQKRDCLGHDFMLAALLSVVRLPAPLLESPVHDDAVPFAEVLTTMFGLLTEHDNVHETNFLFQVITLFVSPAHG